MQFNNHSENNDLIHDTLFLCNNTTTASYALVDITRNINTAYHEVTQKIWSAADDWQFDDSNKSDLPIATTNLVHNQKDYELPSSARKIIRVEAKDQNENWVKLKGVDFRDITEAVDEHLETAGTPREYDLIGDSVFLRPKPSSAYVTTGNGLKIYFSRDVDEFTTASTTATPGFATQFHRILSISAAVDFVRDTEQRSVLVAMKRRLEDGLVKFYSTREMENRPEIKPYAKKRWKQYM